MDEINSGTIYSKLLQILQTASLYEIRLKQFIHESKIKAGNSELFKQIDDIATTNLPALMGKLINRYELHTAFVALARYIRSFDDAAYVIEKLGGLLTERMAGDKEHREIHTLITETEKYLQLVDVSIG